MSAGFSSCEPPHSREHPKRVRLSRKKGYRKPEGAIVVARPSRWGNPFTIAGAIENEFAHDEDSARLLVVQCFSDVMVNGRNSPWWFEYGATRFDFMREHIDELYGHDLACWCPLDQPCHADVLLELANPLAQRGTQQ